MSLELTTPIWSYWAAPPIDFVSGFFWAPFFDGPPPRVLGLYWSFPRVLSVARCQSCRCFRQEGVSGLCGCVVQGPCGSFLCLGVVLFPPPPPPPPLCCVLYFFPPAPPPPPPPPFFFKCLLVAPRASSFGSRVFLCMYRESMSINRTCRLR